MTSVIVLEHPRIPSDEHFNDIANTPLWSCLMGGYVAAAIESVGHQIEFFDTTAKGWSFKKTLRKILESSPDLLAVNHVYFWEKTIRFYEFLSQLRVEGFTGHINLFGFFPTLSAKQIFENSASIDSIAVGECENTLVELIESIQRQESEPHIPGLARRNKKGVISITHRTPVENVDKFVFPKREKTGEPIGILGSRGCYNHCSFCPIPDFYNQGALWRGRSPENIVQEIKVLQTQGFHDFYFLDPNFIGPGKKGKKRILKLAGLLEPLNITFGMETRPNDLDQEILEALIPAGFTSLLLGIESGSSAVLGNLDKSASIHASEKAIQLCRFFGIEPEIGFLMFVPDSTLDDLQENVEFLLRNNLLDRLDRTANLLSHNQIVLQGTAGYECFQREGRVSSHGVFGTEGIIEYHDSWVKKVSELIRYACLLVLQETSKPESPLYYKKTNDYKEFSGLNEYLVNLFLKTLKDAQTDKLPQFENQKKQIEMEITDHVK